MTNTLHWMTKALWAHRLGTDSDQFIFDEIHNRLVTYMCTPTYLGSGGEGFVYRDEDRIKKFIINWGIGDRNIDVVTKRLADMATKIENPKHLYAIEVAQLDKDVLMVSYQVEELKPVTKQDIERHWWDNYEYQFQEFSEEMIETGYFQAGLNVDNFMLTDRGLLKLVDYGCDCLPAQEAIPILAKYLFTARLGLYNLFGTQWMANQLSIMQDQQEDNQES